jgi:uncharacterized protein YdaU (DUF1376 family)
MPLYIGDYLAETQHLSAEQSGAYLHLLMHEWRVGPLPVDLDVLRRIARVEKDAWSNAWAMLEHFFTRTEAGYTQARLEVEKVKSRQNRERFSNRGKAAAEKRWSKSNVMPEHPLSNAQAVLDGCPSPSPSPSPIKQKRKTSCVKREIDSRHADFRELTGMYWAHKNPEIAMPWDASEGKQLTLLLAANPALDGDVFKGLLNQRAKSQVNHAERPRVWLSKVTDYARGPLNEFNKPLGGQNAKYRGKTESSIEAARAAVEAIENRASTSPFGYSSKSEIGDGGLSSIRDGSRNLRIV